jgi:hypothetical protein
MMFIKVVISSAQSLHKPSNAATVCIWLARRTEGLLYIHTAEQLYIAECRISKPCATMQEALKRMAQFRQPLTTAHPKAIRDEHRGLPPHDLCETIANMDSNSGSTLDNDKAQHEALVQTLDVPESDTSTFSLIWRPAALLLIPLVLTLTSIYLSFSWTVYFENNLDTANWTHMGNYFGPDDVNWYCFSNGTAAPQLMKANSGMATVWDTNQFLDITLGFGSFEFGVAKGIDIGWDLVVGRGGQILLALFSYRVCSAVLLHSMETRAVSLYTYTAVGFDRGPLLSIWASLRDLWSGRSQGKGVLSMVIFASLYLLAFPTFVSVPYDGCIDLLILVLGLDHDRI